MAAYGYTNYLVSALALLPELVYDVLFPLGLADLKKLPMSHPELKFPSYTPALPVGLSEENKIFEWLSEHEIMLFIPYDCFEGLVFFLNATVSDPGVWKIQMTLYRLGSESLVVKIPDCRPQKR